MKKLLTVSLSLMLVLSTSGVLPNLAYAKNDNNNDGGTGFSDCGNGNDKNNNGSDSHNKDLPCNDKDHGGDGDGGNATTTGSITVCKVILDANGNPTAGTEGQTFSIALTGPNSFNQTATFSAPIDLNSSIVNGGDAQCQSIQNLPINSGGDANNTYDYAQETGSVSDTSTWKAPLYDDQYNNDLTHYSDASAYVADGQPGDTDDNDGVIILSADRPDRTLIVVNQLEGQSCEEGEQAVSNTYNSDTSTAWGVGTTTGNNPSLVVTPQNSGWSGAQIPNVDWIWATNPTTAEDALGNVTYTFTRHFTITGTPTDSSLDMSADNGYDIKVNGIEIASDPTEFNYHSIHSFPIPAADLVTGDNNITITVTNQTLTDAEGGAAAGTPDNNPGGLTFRLVVNENDCSTPPPACDANNTVQSFVSDTTDTYLSTVLAPGNAVPTFVHQLWAPATGDLAGATWIWDSFHVTDPSNDETVVFTKHLLVTGTNVESATIYLASDNGYKVVVNGHLEGGDHLGDVGNDYGVPNHIVIPAADLVGGDNILTITVKNDAYGTQDPEVNPAGLIYKVTVTSDNCNPPTPPNSCPNDETPTTVANSIISDTSTQVDAHNSVFVGTPYHPAWTAAISGVKWIWSEDPIADAVSTTTKTFTRTFNITGTPQNSTLEIAADNSFTVWVNGFEVGANAGGTNYSAPTQTFAIPAGILNTGSNTITFTVVNWQMDGGTPATNPAGLLYKLTQNETDCGGGNTPPPVENTCALPSAIDGETNNSGNQVAFGMSSGPENTVAQMLSPGYPTLDTATQQTDTQQWNGTNNNVDLTVAHINGQSGDTHTFGYFLNGDNSTFHPIYADGVDPANVAVPVKANGESLNLTIPNVSSVIFGIVNYDPNTGIHTTFYTKDSLNPDGNERAVTYNPTADEYVIAFEDFSPFASSDHDYNDILTSVKVTGCENGPVCNPDTNLITNGSFEAPVVTNGAGWDIFPSGTSTLGWVADWFGGSTTFGLGTRPLVANVELQKDGIVSGWNADAGNQWTELDSDWDGPGGALNGEPASVAISQTLPTIVGKTYKLTFAFAPRPGTSDNGLQVLDNGSVFGTVGPAAAISGVLDWAPETFSFVATTTSTTVTLRDTSAPDSLGTMVDNVGLACQPPVDTCPEGEHLNSYNHCVENGDNPPAPSADISITKYVNDHTPDVDSNVIYTITVKNNGTDDATGVVAHDVLPAGITWISDDSTGAYVPGTGVWTIGNLDAGDTVKLHITAEVTTTEETVNTATVTSTTSDPDGNNNTSGGVDVTGQPVEDIVTPDVTPTDMCQNIGGVQATVPDGDIQQDGNCFPTGGGGGGGIHPLFLGGNGGGNGGHVLGASTSNDNSCTLYLTSYLRIGKKNPVDQVKKLQTFLNAYLGLNIPVTGFFGPATLAAVNQFQVKEGQNVLDPWVKAGLHDSDTDPTGYVYKTTERWINLIMCNSLNLPVPSLP